MRFPGYWVCADAGKVVLERTTFDDTELDPATNWMQAWQNQDGEGLAKGYVEFRAALISAATSLAQAAGLSLSQADLDRAIRFDPVWHEDRCEIESLVHMLASSTS